MHRAYKTVLAVACVVGQVKWSSQSTCQTLVQYDKDNNHLQFCHLLQSTPVTLATVALLYSLVLWYAMLSYDQPVDTCFIVYTSLVNSVILSYITVTGWSCDWHLSMMLSNPKTMTICLVIVEVWIAMTCDDFGDKQRSPHSSPRRPMAVHPSNLNRF